VLSRDPDKEWGTRPADAPPSYTQSQSPAIGFVTPASADVPSGGQTTVTLGAQNVSTGHHIVTWTVDSPDGLEVTPDSGSFALTGGGRARTTVAVSRTAPTEGSSNASGSLYSAGSYVRVHMRADGADLPPVVLQVTEPWQEVPKQDVAATASSIYSSAFSADKAVDGDPRTLWHTSPAATNPLPATLTLNLGNTYDVRGIHYLPRQDANANGNITDYEISVSRDGTEFTPIANGNWIDDGLEKYATWTPTPARYVRLTARAAHFSVAAAAEVSIGYAP
jgi:hypothetical protein